MGRTMSVSQQDSTGHEMKTSNRAFAIEQHGIDFIPPQERKSRPLDLFWIWLGANVIFVYIIDGVLIVGFGLGFWPALAAVLIGNAFFVLLGLTSLAGPKAGTAMLVISRGAFGIRGNFPASILSWFTAVGWEAVNIVIGTLALDQLIQLTGIRESVTLKAISLLIIIVTTFGVTIFGHATITLMNRILSYVLGIGTIILGIYVLPLMKMDLHPKPGAGTTSFGAWLLALLIMAAAPLSWVNCGSDYSRYLPKKTSGAKIVLWTTLGGLIPGVLITIVGVAAATATDMSDPVGGLKKILPAWFFAFYLAVIVGGTITNNFLNTYSSSMSLLALGLKIKRYKAVFIDATLGTLISIYAIFFNDFTNTFIGFLSVTVLWLAPWCGVYLADSLLRKGEYTESDLHGRGGQYWYQRGWNVRAVAWFAIGMVVGGLFSSNAIWQGSFVKYIGGGDLSIFVSFLVAGLGYYLTMRNKIATPKVAS